MTISILGCGWIGLPLAEFLTTEGHTIKGSTTRVEKFDEIRDNGAEPYLITLSPEINKDHDTKFWESDILILNIPPGRKTKDVETRHPKQIKAVIDQLIDSPVKFVVFVSSTSVYPPSGGVMSEDDAVEGKATRSSGNALLRAEKMLREQKSFKSTILRFGGLYGYDRHPVKYLAGRKKISRGNAPINLLHRDDAVRIIHRVIEREMVDEILNAVSDGHPPRNQYYRAAAEFYGLEEPIFKKDDQTDYKIVSNKKLKHMLEYDFIYPNPMDFSVTMNNLH